MSQRLPLTILPFPRDLEGSQVFQPAEIAQMRSVWLANRDEALIRKHNVWICSIAHALCEMVRRGPAKRQLLELCATEADPKNLSVEVFSYTQLARRSHSLSIADDHAMREDDRDTTVQSALYRLTGQLRPLSYTDLKLREILKQSMGTLDLASWFVDGEGRHFRFCTRTDSSEPGHTDGYVVLHRSIRLCFYPEGMPMYLSLGIQRAAQRWDLLPLTALGSDAETVSVGGDD
jgi:hypothetical protein